VSTDRFLCIHGHFYQPPRENPWLETIEYQESSFPYHDWNDRITAECYGPNASARILDGDAKIVNIVNNYASVSFNIGPTLLSWMQDHAPDVYQAILDADLESLRRYNGHGSAIAQAYNHMILPLANQRDKYTQVRWGIRDFQHRFGRFPEGMWLPETAVDTATLEVLADSGIRFTILSPYQARRVRPIGGDQWSDVVGGKIDPTMPYRLKLRSGKTIDAFFYDGPISRAVAFEGLLSRGEQFADRLMSGFSDARRRPQLMHIATDGESYGHHHRWGEMALAYALDHIDRNRLAQRTVYGEYLKLFPPTHEVEIIENTSWSCFHGVERWRSDCGCNSGGHAWSQAWRGPLRAALDRLRDAVAPLYAAKAGEYLRDPWAARDGYIDVVLERSQENVRRFLAEHTLRELAAEETTTVLRLLEMQRNAMLMYTSCGWFFDEISGIETVQIIQYAGRVIQLAGDVFKKDLERRFLRDLATAKSNIPEQGSGAQIYARFVKPAVVNTLQAGAHYAVSSMFKEHSTSESRYRYKFDLVEQHRLDQGVSRLAVGHARVTSEVTWTSHHIAFGVLHFGDHNLSAGVREFRGEEAFGEMSREVVAAFERADLPQVLRLLDKHFGGATYSFKSLFRDEQREILGPFLAGAIADSETSATQVYEHHAPLLAFLSDIHLPIPRSLHALAELVLNVRLRDELSNGLDRERIVDILSQVRRTGVPLHEERLRQLVRDAVERRARELQRKPTDVDALRSTISAVEVAQLFPFGVDLWKVQNVYWSILNDRYSAARNPEGAQAGDRLWREQFAELGTRLGVRVPG
jgi:alpha-amylase/alpha-mannosidase (GH57 family)